MYFNQPCPRTDHALLDLWLRDSHRTIGDESPPPRFQRPQQHSSKPFVRAISSSYSQQRQPASGRIGQISLCSPTRAESFPSRRVEIVEVSQLDDEEAEKILFPSPLVAQPVVRALVEGCRHANYTSRSRSPRQFYFEEEKKVAPTEKENADVPERKEEQSETEVVTGGGGEDGGGGVPMSDFVPDSEQQYDRQNDWDTEQPDAWRTEEDPMTAVSAYRDGTETSSSPVATQGKVHSLFVATALMAEKDKETQPGGVSQGVHNTVPLLYRSNRRQQREKRKLKMEEEEEVHGANVEGEEKAELENGQKKPEVESEKVRHQEVQLFVRSTPVVASLLTNPDVSNHQQTTTKNKHNQSELRGMLLRQQEEQVRLHLHSSGAPPPSSSHSYYYSADDGMDSGTPHDEYAESILAAWKVAQIEEEAER